LVRKKPLSAVRALGLIEEQKAKIGSVLGHLRSDMYTYAATDQSPNSARISASVFCGSKARRSLNSSASIVCFPSAGSFNNEFGSQMTIEQKKLSGDDLIAEALFAIARSAWLHAQSK
jgi:hypothetical protein